MPLKVRLVKSTMTRATQTGDIIVERLKAAGAPVDEVLACDLIQEGAPCVPEPPIGKELWDPGADVRTIKLFIPNTFSIFAYFKILSPGLFGGGSPH